MSLKTRMTVAVSLLVVGLLSVMAVITLGYFGRQLEDTIARQQFSMVAAMADQIDEKIRAAHGELAAVAMSISPAVVDNPLLAQNFLDDHLDTQLMFDSGIYLFSPAGRLIAQTSPNRKMAGRDFSTRDYVREVMISRAPVVSEPFLSEEPSPRPVIMFSVPVFDDSRTVIAVFAGSIDLLKNNFLGTLAEIRLGQKGYLYLYNTQRTMVLHPDRQRILKKDVPTGFNRLYDQAVEGFEGTGPVVTSRGVKMLSSFKRLKTTNWILAANYPIDEVYAPVHQARRFFMAAIVVMVAISLVLVRFFMGHLAGPLLLLTAHVRKMAGTDDLSVSPLHLDCGDEIGELAGAFNSLAETVGLQKKSLVKQKEFAESLVRNSSVPTFVIDADHRVLFWSKTCEELTGVSARDVVGTTEHWRAFYGEWRSCLADVVITGSQEQSDELFSSLRSSELIPGGLQAEGWFADLNGRERYILFSAAPIRDGDGNIIAAIESIEDITARRRSEETLKIQEARMRTILEIMPVGVWVADADGLLLTGNREGQRIWGGSRYVGVENYGLYKGWWADSGKLIAPEEWSMARAVRHGETSLNEEIEIECFDGSHKVILNSSVPLRGARGEVVGAVVINQDITGRKRSEEELRAANRAYRLLSTCGQAMVRATDEQQLLQEVCRLIVEVGGYRLAWIGLAEADAEKSVRPVAQAGFEDGYLAAVRVSWGDDEWGRGPSGQAIRNGHPVISRDIMTDPAYAPWREEAERRGFASSAALPLVSDGTILGCFNVYAAEPDAFDDEEIRLFEKLAGDVAYGLAALRTQTALREFQERITSVFESMTDGFIAFDREWRYTFLNRAATELFQRMQITRAELIGACVWERFPELTGTEFENECRRAEREQVAVTLDYYSDLLDIWLEIRLYPVKDGVSLYFTDITKRRSDEEKIRRHVSLLNATLESTADGILVVNREGSVESWNRKFAEMMCIPDEVLATRDDNALLSCALRQFKDPDGFLSRVKELYLDPEMESFDVIEFLDGRIVERVSLPQRLGDEVVGRVWSFRDVTEQRKLENQLSHAQRMESIGTLAGGVAHDFNNILTAIIGYCKILELNLAEEQLPRHCVKQIVAASEKAAALTRSLLTYSRKQVLEMKPTDLNDIVSDTSKLLARVIGEDIEVTLGLSNEKLIVLADCGQIGQVLMNLSVNARDAQPAGGRLRIETRRVELGDDFVRRHGFGVPGGYALLSVADAGVGMDADTVARIFEPFFTTKEVGKGTGLGLSIIYGIVKSHQGFILVDSEPDMGTTFRIYLPLATSTSPEHEQVGETSAPGGWETILLIEDNADLRALFREMLEYHGYRVIDAVDGEDGLKKFSEQSGEIQLLLLDMVMPKMNGKQVYDEIHRSTPGVKVLFMSGYTADVISDRGIREEELNFIAKPFSPDLLLRKIREVLES